MANSDTLTAFLAVINDPANANYQDPDFLANHLFCQNDLTVTPRIPCVGITDHGPAFYLRAGVKTLFAQLFTTFGNMQWTQVNVPLTAANEIGIQMTITGQYQAKWFQPAAGHVSPPLSQLGPGPMGSLGKNRTDSSGLPAFAVFTFNDSYLIKQLQIYLDRYAMMQSIMGADLRKKWDPDAPAYDVMQSAEHHKLTIGGTHGRRITISIED